MTRTASVAGFSVVGLSREYLSDHLFESDVIVNANATWISSQAAADEKCLNRFESHCGLSSWNEMRQKIRNGFGFCFCLCLCHVH